MITAAVSDIEAFLELLARLDGVFDAPPPEGDPVDLLQHGLQCAHELRERRPADVELQLAGLVHDIGHAVSEDPDHARTGAAYVRPLLGERVAELVGAHVEAKRYLAAVEDYDLSVASALSLRRQGAAMTAAEVDAFLRRPVADAAVALRRADEAAKVVGRIVPGLGTWAPVLRDHVQRLSHGATA